MKGKQRPEEDTGAWMNTYSDLVTLLLCFFVLLYSMSSVNAEKWEAFVKAFSRPGNDTAQVVINPGDLPEGDEPFQNVGGGDQIGDSTSEPFDPGALPEDFSDLYFYLQQYMEENNLSSTVEVSQSGDSVVYIRFQNNIFFDPDKYILRSQAYDILNYVGDCLQNVEDEIYIISINGHTADVPYDYYAVSDWMLSSERASSVAIFFDTEKGIDPQKIRSIGYGKNFPIASNDTQEGREKNRRVDITIVKNSSGGGWSDADLAGLFDPTQFPKSGGTQDILTPDGSATSLEDVSPPENALPPEETLPPEDDLPPEETIPSGEPTE